MRATYRAEKPVPPATLFMHLTGGDLFECREHFFLYVDAGRGGRLAFCLARTAKAPVSVHDAQLHRQDYYDIGQTHSLPDGLAVRKLEPWESLTLQNDDSPSPEDD